MTSAADINQKVLDAFQVEHREQLEQMRKLLAQFKPGEQLAGDDRINEAFRMAHSFKGGARVCGLKPAEQLGHALEAVLERIVRGEMGLEADVVTTINRVLDTIEDWMTALRGNGEPCDTNDTLELIERLLKEASATETPARCPPEFLRQIRETYCREYQESMQRVRDILQTFHSRGELPVGEELIEAGRLVHSLAGAAAAAGEEHISDLCRSLELALAHQERGKQPAPMPEVLKLIRSADAQMRESFGIQLASPFDKPTTQDNLPTEQNQPSEDRPALEVPAQEAREKTPPKSAATSSAESVRISVESLDRLMRSAGRLMIESQRQDRITLDFSQLRKQIEELERCQESAHQASALSVRHREVGGKNAERLTRYLDEIDQRIHDLAHLSRQVSLNQQRTAWMFRTQTRQVQQDVHAARMVPAESVFQGFRKMVRDLAKDEGKQIDLHVQGFDVRADRLVLQELKDPLMHMLRNCVTHGIESPEERTRAGKSEQGMVSLALQSSGNQLTITVEDDGRGINSQQLVSTAVKRGLLSEAASLQRSEAELSELVFEPGLTTSQSVTELSGRGMGLSVAHEAVERLQGQIQLQPRQGGGTCFRLSLPTTVSTHRLLTVRSGQEHFVLPLRGIERLMRVAKAELETVEGRPVIIHNEWPLSLVWLDTLLGLKRDENVESEGDLTIIVLSLGAKQSAVVVDGIVEERDSLVHAIDEELDCREATGAVILDNGQVALVLNAAELLDRAHLSRTRIEQGSQTLSEPTEPPKVLVVDDSFTTRTLEKSILESRGYQVKVAVDGLEALAQLRRMPFDLVISDVEMPGMDGFQLLEQVKSDHRLRSIPVILVTSRDRSEDQERGLHLGAEAYIIKRKFDHQDLLRTIEQVL